MGMRLNPATGQMEDDGLGDPAAQPAGALPVGAVPFFPPKPEHERTVTTEQRTPSVQSQQAQGEVIATQADVLNATNRETEVATQEAGVKATAADQATALLEAQKKDEADAEAARVRTVAEHKEADDKEIEEARKAKMAAGSARADFWQGNASGEILAAVLRGIDRAASSFRGETGPTGVDRVIEAKIADHERKMVGAWEATKEANDLKRTNRGAYEKELDRRRIQAANQSMLELKLLEARTDKALAALGPERAKALGEAKTAAFQHGYALTEQKRVEGYDKVTREAETNRSLTSTGSGGGRGSLTQGQGELAGSLSSMTAELRKFQGAKVSQDALKKWQGNVTAMAGAERTASQGVLGSTLVNKLRDFGVSPRQEFEGIRDADKKAILSRKRGLDQLSKIMTGAAATDPEVRRREQQWLIQPGDSDEIVADKTQSFMDFIASRAVGAGSAAPAIQQNLAGAAAAAPSTPTAQPAVPPGRVKAASSEQLRAILAKAEKAGDAAAIDEIRAELALRK